MLTTLLQVALGGAIGATARYLTSMGALRLFGAGFPWGTLAVNVIGSFLMGLLVVVLVGLISLAPVEQDSWWQESALVPHFLMVADWSKNLILGLSSEWLASGVTASVELPFKEALQQPKLP